jgi:hypothetical protein
MRYGAWLLLLTLAISLPMAQGQTSPPSDIGAALSAMSAQAAVIFAGEVQSVKRTGATSTTLGGSAGIVEIQFQVENAVKGVVAGSTYTMREWAGLWNGISTANGLGGGGLECFHVGERALYFLRAPGPGGLSSPVDGMDGVLPLSSGSAPAFSDDSSAAQAYTQGELATASTATAASTNTVNSAAASYANGAGETDPDPDEETLVDTRWLATHVVRAAPPMVAAPQSARSAVLNADGQPLADSSISVSAGTAAQPAQTLSTTAATSTQAEGAARWSLATVLGMLMAAPTTGGAK